MTADDPVAAGEKEKDDGQDELKPEADKDNQEPSKDIDGDDRKTHVVETGKKDVDQIEFRKLGEASELNSGLFQKEFVDERMMTFDDMSEEQKD